MSSSSFADEIMSDFGKLVTEAEKVFAEVAEDAWNSVVNGSGITGAPGQPVATGDLKRSFGSGPRFVNSRLAFIESDDPKALYVEIDARNIVFRNGGPHNVKLTELRFQRLQDAVTAKRWDSLVIGP